MNRGSYRLAPRFSLRVDAAVALFCDSVLGAFEQSEDHYGGELIRSLEAFIEENGQWERAVKRLCCHPHTLQYRIKRVEAHNRAGSRVGPGSNRILARAARKGIGGVNEGWSPD